MVAAIQIEKFLGSDNNSYIELCKYCGLINRVKFTVRLFERRQMDAPDIKYLCVKCLVSMSYAFLNVKKSGKGGE
jgi:hypothetical protein